MIKRLFDITIAFLGLAFLLPFLLIVTVLIKLDSPGPVFFCQTRVGRNGKLFRIFKFRTMVHDAEILGPHLTEPNDPRITQIGALLRWCKVDELPQLINVLIGEMSFVGPRPELPYIVNLYTSEQKKILDVRPGVVGPNQILGRHEIEEYPDNVEVEEFYLEHILPRKLQVDLEYVKNARFINDLRWFFRGIRITIMGSFKIGYLFQGKRRITFLSIDIVLTVLSCYLAFFLRYEGVVPANVMTTFFWMAPSLVLIRVPFYVYFGLYQTLWQYLGLTDVFAITKAVLLSSMITVLGILMIGFRNYSRSLLILDTFILLILLGGFRVLFKLCLERLQRNLVRYPQRNVLIVGAGDAGEVVVHELIRRPETGMRPVGFLDEDIKKLGMKIHGIKVLGALADFKRVCKVKQIKEVILAIPDLTTIEIQGLFAHCKKMGLACKIAPRIRHLVIDRTSPFKIRDADIEDLLGRKEAKLDYQAVHELLCGKTVLITGGAGSIGSELARQVMEHAPRRLLIVDRSENDLFEIDHEFGSQFAGKNWSCHLVDILNKEDLENLFRTFLPQVVFHAAAYKHVPLMESNVKYAIRGNVFGTKNVVDLACEHGISHCVLVSTDKAVNPSSVMGATKRIAELYVQCMASANSTKLITVRFGNVLSSRGSVVPLFLKQIQMGGPITVTHPDIQRFFMAISEAVLLILQAAVQGKGGELFRLEMGEPIKILDLAKTLIRLGGLREDEIEIRFTGLRPGEKLFEELVGSGEVETPTAHEKIYLIQAKSQRLVDKGTIFDKLITLQYLLAHGAENVCVDEIRELVPEYVGKAEAKLDIDRGIVQGKHIHKKGQ